jgi:hypothetical protein
LTFLTNNVIIFIELKEKGEEMAKRIPDEII